MTMQDASVLIVVVDDEADMEALFRQQFRRDLREGRFDIAFADSGSRALEVLAWADGRDIILLLSDVNMPGMSGFELLDRIRRDRPDLPVIMITAYGDAETRRRATQAGAADVLAKPVDFSLLRVEIDRRLAGRMPTP